MPYLVRTTASTIGDRLIDCDGTRVGRDGIEFTFDGTVVLVVPRESLLSVDPVILDPVDLALAEGRPATGSVGHVHLAS